MYTLAPVMFVDQHSFAWWDGQVSCCMQHLRKDVFGIWKSDRRLVRTIFRRS